MIEFWDTRILITIYLSQVFGGFFFWIFPGYFAAGAAPHGLVRFGPGQEEPKSYAFTSFSPQDPTLSLGPFEPLHSGSNFELPTSKWRFTLQSFCKKSNDFCMISESLMKNPMTSIATLTQVTTIPRWGTPSGFQHSGIWYATFTTTSLSWLFWKAIASGICESRSVASCALQWRPRLQEKPSEWQGLAQINSTPIAFKCFQVVETNPKQE